MHCYPTHVIVERLDPVCGLWEEMRCFELPSIRSEPDEDYRQAYREARCRALKAFHPDYNTHTRLNDQVHRIVEVAGSRVEVIWANGQWESNQLCSYLQDRIHSK